jgi:hypothetical protein
MSIPRLTEHKLKDLSAIQVRYFVGALSKVPHFEILIIKYVGVYPFGSAGNGDALYIYAMAKAGVGAFEPWGVIHDLSELSYEWGDMLEMVFDVGPDYENSPRAIVVGSVCAEAVRTLLLGENSNEPLEKVGNVFRSLEEAWIYVEAQQVE